MLTVTNTTNDARELSYMNSIPNNNSNNIHKDVNEYCDFKFITNWKSRILIRKMT